MIAGSRLVGGTITDAGVNGGGDKWQHGEIGDHHTVTTIGSDQSVKVSSGGCLLTTTGKMRFTLTDADIHGGGSVWQYGEVGDHHTVTAVGCYQSIIVST